MHSSIGRILVRLLVLAVLSGGAAVLSAGYLGWLHGAFDSFSHFRVHVAAGLLLMILPLLALRLRIEAVFALVLGATALIGTIGIPSGGRAGVTSASQADEGGDRVGAVYRLMQLNLRFDNADPGRILSLIGRVKPDVVTLNEVSAQWLPKLALLEAAYPHRIVCSPPAGVGGSAILSRRPLAGHPGCADRGALALATVDFSGRPVDVAALHMGWPWPFEQPWQLPRVEAAIASLADTAILAGDMNAAPWSQTVRRVEAAGGLRALRGIGPTWLFDGAPDWLRRHAGLPIDQVMVKGGVLPLSVQAIEDAGSDHLPVLMEFTVLAEEEPASVLQAVVVNGEW